MLHVVRPSGDAARRHAVRDLPAPGSGRRGEGALPSLLPDAGPAPRHRMVRELLASGVAPAAAADLPAVLSDDDPAVQRNVQRMLAGPPRPAVHQGRDLGRRPGRGPRLARRLRRARGRGLQPVACRRPCRSTGPTPRRRLEHPPAGPRGPVPPVREIDRHPRPSLQDYFTTHALALPGDHDRARAAGRRQRRIDAVPEPLRPAVAGFADSLLASGQRAQRARTRPRSDSTIDSALGTIRDLATFLHADGKDDWALAAHGDIEGFLAARGPGSRPRALTVVRQFCRWARARKLILVDPTRAISIRRPRGFTGQTLGIARQRELFTRWTTDPHVHPNEALAGLLALLHGASSQEIRELTERDVDLAAGTMRIGRRPHPTPVDPITQDAIRRCVEHRRNLATANPHLLVTRGTKADSRPASAAYLRHLFDPVGHAPKDMRVTRLAELARTMDPKLVADAFGLNHQGVLCYLRDTVDPGRLPAELANPSAFGAT